MPAMLRVFVIAGLVALLAMPTACKREQAEVGAGRRVATPGQPPPPPPPPDARPAIDEAAVRAFIDRWRQAQNEGDLDAYAALYADAFEGIKRAGEAEQRFDRAGWLVDRKRMFTRPMSVAVDELRVTITGPRARVEFVQTWSSGSFGDRGNKRMEIKPRPSEPGALHIVREEMLDSRIVATDAACLQALFPRYREATRRIDAEPEAARVESVTVLEPGGNRAGGAGGQFVCLVQTFVPSGEGKSGSGDLVLALLGRKGKRWSVIERLEHAYTVEDEEDDTGITTATRASVALAAIAPAENAIVYTIEERRDGPMIGDADRHTKLYRVTATGLEELLALESKISGGESDSATTETFSIDATRVTNGFHDIEIERVSTADNWHADEHREERDTDRLQWNGTEYEEVGY
jgi:hypothetical protein